jgi:sugar O-acyltransferase (sialic acid O-acetyltransferase NeuD family)
VSLPSLVIWGSGGHAKVAQAAGFQILCFADDSANEGAQFLGHDVVRPHSSRVELPGIAFLVAIGNNEARARCFETGLQMGWIPATVIHPSAVISVHSVIGDGTVVMPHVVVNAASVVGRNCILNTSAVIEHDCVIQDHVHISPAATLAGDVVVEALAHIGMAASVLPGCRIGRSATVGAGAVVTGRVGSNSTVVGVPARALLTNKAKSRDFG